MYTRAYELQGPLQLGTLWHHSGIAWKPSKSDNSVRASLPRFVPLTMRPYIVGLLKVFSSAGTLAKITSMDLFQTFLDLRS